MPRRPLPHDHGSIERRRHVVIHDVGVLDTHRRFPGEPRFPGFEAIATAEPEVERGGKISRERRFHISPLPLDAKLFARAVREHWHIEKRLRWVLDVVLHTDLSRLRSGNGPQNMATVRRITIDLLQGAKDKHSLEVRRTSAAWDEAYLRPSSGRTLENRKAIALGLQAALAQRSAKGSSAGRRTKRTYSIHRQ